MRRKVTTRKVKSVAIEGSFVSPDVEDRGGCGVCGWGGGGGGDCEVAVMMMMVVMMPVVKLVLVVVVMVMQ